MIATVQSYQLNNTVVNVDLREVPNLSGPSKDILSTLNANLPAEFQTVTPLGDRIHSMEETKALLKETQDNNTRNKIIAFLKMAVLTAVVAGSTALFLFGGETAIVLGSLLVFFGYMFLSLDFFDSSMEEIKNINKEIPDYSTPWHLSSVTEYDPRAIFAMAGGGFVLPLFEACTRESRVQNVLEKKQQSIEETLSQYKTQNEQLLGGAYQFYQEHSAGLLASLDQTIEQLNASHAAMTQLAQRSAAGEQELIDRREAHQKAKAELSTVKEFYKQFDVI